MVIASMYIYDTFVIANNKGADYTVRMRRLVCACVVRKPPKTGFLASRPYVTLLFSQYSIVYDESHQQRANLYHEFAVV